MKEFQRQYMGQFPPHPVYKAVRRALGKIQYEYKEKKRGKTIINPPSESLLYSFQKSLERGNCDPEESLAAILVALAQQGDEFFYKLIEKERHTIRPIIIDADL